MVPVELTIYIPGPIVAKSLKLTARGNFARAYRPANLRAYMDTISQEAILAMRKAGYRKPMKGAFCVEVAAIVEPPKSWPKGKREAAMRSNYWHTVKPDMDNILKLKDALKGIVWDDDCQVAWENGFKKYGRNAGLTFQIHTLGP